VHLVATEVLSGKEALLSTGDAVPAVLASASIPAVFPAVDIDGRPLFDGGVANNAPITHAVALGADRVVVLPAGYACALPAPPATALASAIHAMTLLVQQRLIRDVEDYRGSAELIVLPPLCPVAVSSADFSHAADLITRARRATCDWLAERRYRQPHPERFLSMHGHADAAGSQHGPSRFASTAGDAA
jgi:NTE family protein